MNVIGKNIRGSEGPRIPQAMVNFLTADFALLSTQAARLYKGGWIALWVGIAVAVYVLTSSSEFLVPFLTIALPLMLGIGIWTSNPFKGIPVFPLFLIQQGLVYGLPLVVGNDRLKAQPFELVSTSAVSVGGFLLVCIAGWQMGRRGADSLPSRWNLALTESSNAASRSLRLALILLAISAGFNIGNRAGLFFSLLPGDLVGLMPIIHTFAGAAAMLGALFGGLVVGQRGVSTQTLSFWVLLALNFFLLVADVLISAGSSLVLSAAVGLALGMRTVPWRFLVVSLGIVGFLNQGKFVMRERYWIESNSASVSVSNLPAFYAEWAGASAEMLFKPTPAAVISDLEQSIKENDGQSILDRIDNFQNMNFVVDAMERGGIPALGGDTYTLIPPLLIPRFLWPDKPRTHEGQVLLNLHFGRQTSEKATEQTYIAWGLLPEAVGNFGVWLGPVLLGLALGWIMGRVEIISLHKRFFSLEGMILISTMLMLAGSYEMVASVFVTAIFQLLIAVGLCGTLMLAWFGRAAPAAAHANPFGKVVLGNGAIPAPANTAPK